MSKRRLSIIPRPADGSALAKPWVPPLYPKNFASTARLAVETLSALSAGDNIKSLIAFRLPVSDAVRLNRHRPVTAISKYCTSFAGRL
jgi:hypothetical protein